MLFFKISGWKRMVFRRENWSFKKCKTSTFSKGDNPWFLFKNQTFSHIFFGRKHVIKDFFFILDRKEWFLDQTIEVVKSAKNRHFPEGIIHRFCLNIKLFLIFFLGENKSVFFWYFGWKRTIFRPENLSSKKC